MRPVLHGDVVCAARALYARPPAERPTAMARLLVRAEAADAYRKRFGRAHPAWGNGSLMALAAREELPPEPPLDDFDYCLCLAHVFTALASRQVAKALSARN